MKMCLIVDMVFGHQSKEISEYFVMLFDSNPVRQSKLSNLFKEI